MLTEDEKLAVQNFYTSQVDQMAGGEYLRDFLLDDSIGYIQLGDERGYVKWEEYSTPQGKSAIRIKNVMVKQIENNDVPESVLKAFQRYIWCSRYSLSDVRVVKFLVGEVVTFAIYNEAYVDDGWDGELNSWEIYDSEGDLVGSLIFFNSAWQFQNEEIEPSDFSPPVPPYIPNADQQSVKPFWSAENGQWLLPMW
ncbi:MAG: hypothetical protein ACRC80_35225 [Waterburya sp.]